MRLSVRNRRIQGSTADIDVGTVKFADGQAENVKLTKPVFVVAPSGSYRATADLSIGGGVLGQMNMGQARATVVATIARSSSTISPLTCLTGVPAATRAWRLRAAARRRSRRNIENVDIAGPLTALAGSAVPLTGRATGRVNLTFPGTDVKLASGSITTQLTANTGDASPDRIPINGKSRCVRIAACLIFNK